jgi:hypothetical protein
MILLGEEHHHIPLCLISVDNYKGGHEPIHCKKVDYNLDIQMFQRQSYQNRWGFL